MNRFTTILGFAVLAVAATLAAMITMRNEPAPERRESQIADARERRVEKRVFEGEANDAGANRAVVRASRKADQVAVVSPTPLVERARAPRLKVVLDERRVGSLTEIERVDLQARVETVERRALERMDELTEELRLTPYQKVRIFPSVLRSTAGYDPAMMANRDSKQASSPKTERAQSSEAGTGSREVGRTESSEETVMTTDEEIHAELDFDQQEVIEDETVDRQLWWQSVIGKLEADLVRDTGGEIPHEVEEDPAVDASDEAGEREAPDAREGGNLFDMLGQP